MDLSRISYDPATGEFRWVRPASNRVKPGDVAGSLMRNGYITIMLDGQAVLAHRLAWLITHGVEPSGHIDHINGVKTDNRACNLRDVTPAENAQNRHAVSSATGYLGVMQRPSGRFGAYMTTGKVSKCLGTFDTAEEASSAYWEARAKRERKQS